MIILTELTRLGELKAIASECEQAVETTDSFELRAALYLVADYFRSRARILSKVRGEKE